MKIGRVKLKNGFFLAPMADFSTAPFRRLCRECGAGLTTSEMVSCEAAIHRNWRTERLVARAKGEKPFAIQVFGSEPKRIALAGEMLEKKCEILDVNLGCPSKKITEQGAGAALLRKPKRIAEIFDCLSSVKVPVTAKMRLGIGTKARCVEIAKLIERGGASALTVHGRTAEQGYSGKADLKAIKRIADALSIPVIGNGDVLVPEDAEKMMEKTGCAGVMIGRGALGNPLIFRQMKDYFRKGRYEVLEKGEKVKMLLKFLGYAEDEPVKIVRAQSTHFIKGFPGSAGVRARIMKEKSVAGIRRIARSAF